MKGLLVSFLMLCMLAWAAPKQRPWQDAQVVKVVQSEVVVEETLYRNSAPVGSPGQPVPSGTEKRRTKIITYEFKTDQHSYETRVEKKPIEGIQEGGKVRIAVQKDVLYLQMPDGKERKLELVKTN
jgi:hypothetical protein